MATRQFDTTAVPKTRPVAPDRVSVSQTATPARAGLAQAARSAPVPTVAAQLARSSGDRPARAGHALLQLQRWHGNRYVQRVLGHTRGQPPRSPHPVTAPAIQTKLVVGPAGDRYEREADQMAQAVMRSLSSRADTAGDLGLTPGEPRVSRKVSADTDPLGGKSLDAGNEAAIAGARSRGVALQPALRSRMEAAFGSDFGAVRIHQGPDADLLSRQLQARAFTSGSDIFFASGGYRPASAAGQALLAHELTHVVQQGAAGSIRRASLRPAAAEKTSPQVTSCGGDRTVQRAILAVDGARDDAVAKQATQNCLTNLKSHKQIPTSTGKTVRHYPAGDARGQVYGPDVAATALAGLAAGNSAIGSFETLYFLGHGSTTDIAGLTPANLARGLVTAFAGYPDTFIGPLKIVACYSASTLEDGKPAASGKSYADRIRTELDTRNDPRFRPRFVEGIQGIAWADEDTGQRVGYEVLGERPGKLSPLETVYVDATLVKEWFNALTNPDSATRKANMDTILEKVHKSLGVPAATARRVLGRAARQRYFSGSVGGDFTLAAQKLKSAATSKPPDAALAAAALKRMRLDWATMDKVERRAMQTSAVSAYDAYLWNFQGRRPSWQAMTDEWVI